MTWLESLPEEWLDLFLELAWKANRDSVVLLEYRVEPEGTSHIFIVHGEACTKSDRHPTCTHEGSGQAPEGRAYVLNFQELLGSDWPGCSPSDYEDWDPGR